MVSLECKNIFLTTITTKNGLNILFKQKNQVCIKDLSVKNVKRLRMKGD